jgi:xanthine/CO dehydrogenase XdhC/CoxF family maturation factor
MNERIRELMAEAVTFRLDPDSNAHEAQVCPEDLELFAELIVRECAMFVVTELEGKVGSRIADATANRLEEHFGVE